MVSRALQLRDRTTSAGAIVAIRCLAIALGIESSIGHLFSISSIVSVTGVHRSKAEVCIGISTA